MTAWSRAPSLLRNDASATPVLRNRSSPARSSHAAAAPPRLKLLIVAASFMLPYPVLRCAQRCNVEVYVLGSLGAQSLALSRYCKRFVLSHRIISGVCDEDLAFEINCLARELGVAMVLPGDAPSTRALIASRHLLDVPCFPLPSLEKFDFLNDKWQFAQLCRELDIRHPPTHLLPDIAALEAEVLAGRLAYPLIAKARSLSGSEGVFKLTSGDAAVQMPRINYRSILVQNVIPGRDIGASIYCDSGKIAAFIAHDYRRRVYATFWDESVYRDLARIAAHLRLDGVYNFDMILSDDGVITYLECNPRFYYKMFLSMLAGINFVALGLPGNQPPQPPRLPHGTAVRAPEAVLASPRAWLRVTGRDWAAAAYKVQDPVPLLLDHLGMPWPFTPRRS